jgi:transposase
MKVLFFDGTGICLLYKRLDKSTFRLPEALDPQATSVAIDERELDHLLDAIDVETKSGKSPRVRVH